ncbi:hypothetical protein Droror1_Dr00012881 [Drosera rotundifolia]
MHLRPFVCDIDDCQMSYRRKDHLKRHLIQHQGKLFKCTAKDCNKEFCAQSNMKRHFKNMHELKPMCDSVQEKKKYVCQEVGCGKEFLYESRLRKHEESHVTLDSVEVFCIGCNKPFSNKQCLKAHLASCHRHVTCEVFGCQHLRKNIHRHLRSHEVGSPETIKCDFEDCGRTFSKKSNLQQHIRTVHHKHRRFLCGVDGCGLRLTLKHVRDKHEKTCGCTLRQHLR